MLTPAQSAAPPEDAAERDVWPWPLVVCGYFLFQALYRRLLGGGLGLDEAQMLLWSQRLAWGYGPQPPLYSWLQWAAFQVIPDPLLALALLKNALLATTYLAVYALLRTAHPRHIAGLAALSLFLVPQISWDSQRDMTHSVLVVTLAALTTLVFWTRTLRGTRGGWLAFGLVTGLGAISKANFLVVPVSLLLAAVSMLELRPRLRPSGVALAAAVAAAIAALPVAWVLRNTDRAFSSVGELELSEAGTSPWRTALAGGGEFASAVLSCLALAVVVLGLLRYFRSEPSAAGPGPPELDRLLLRTVLIGLAAILAGILATGATKIQTMWLLPVLYLAVPLAVVRLGYLITAAGARALRRTIAGLALVVVVGLAVHIRYGDPGHPSIRRAPVARVAGDLVARFPDVDRIVADPEWLAGNLIYQRPDLDVVSAEGPGPAPRIGETVILVWWNRTPARRQRAVQRLAERWGGPVEVGRVVPLTAPFPPQPDVPFPVDAARIDLNGVPRRPSEPAS